MEMEKREKQCDSFVFYSTNLETVNKLKETNPDMANELLMAICEYGIYGDYDKSNPIIEAMMINIGFGIDKAKERYSAAVMNGRKGGRPAIELNEEEVMNKKKELKTWKAVAAFYGIEEDTLRKHRKQWESEKTEKPKNLNREEVLLKEKTEKPKNLNDNVNDNENENENEKEESISNEEFLAFLEEN